MEFIEIKGTEREERVGEGEREGRKDERREREGDRRREGER